MQNKSLSRVKPVSYLKANAAEILATLGEQREPLAVMPERGTYPRKLLDLGIKEYRQVFFKPYRLIYRVANGEVMVFVIADGRRDMQSLLVRRLLGA